MPGPPPGLPRSGGEPLERLVDSDGHVQRSLLPLPVPDWCSAPGGALRARSARRRRGHRAHQGELLTELVVALNQLDAGSDL
eukprot:5818655-Pyramimonas_sp.AAC.1